MEELLVDDETDAIFLLRSDLVVLGFSCDRSLSALLRLCLRNSNKVLESLEYSSE